MKISLQFIIVFLLTLFISCNSDTNSQESTTVYDSITEVQPEPTIVPDTIAYTEYLPDSIYKFVVDSMDLKAYKIGTNYLTTTDAMKSISEEDWGDRLLLLSSNQEVLYISEGVGDVYLYEPHFFHSLHSDKTIVICQLGYEYYFGGDVFVYENGQISRIGNIDIEGEDFETSMTEIVQIHEVDDALIFTFDTKELHLQPGSKDTVIPNDNVHYLYKDKKFSLEL